MMVVVMVMAMMAMMVTPQRQRHLSRREAVAVGVAILDGTLPSPPPADAWWSSGLWTCAAAARQRATAARVESAPCVARHRWRR